MKRPVVTVLDDSIHDAFVLTMIDVAAVLSVSPSKARELCVTGKLAGAMRIGTLIRITAGAVRAYINAETLPKQEPDRPDVLALRAESRRRDAADRQRPRGAKLNER
ncbi:MAG TPA: helix-turn-helix domain-containing protein [Candidatus Tumulicola sp.]|nr:helix-turn-helix domain-containing protein [Candidatus Tumulicola sp.]